MSGPLPVLFSYTPSPILTYLVNPFFSRLLSLRLDFWRRSVKMPAIKGGWNTRRIGAPVSDASRAMDRSSIAKSQSAHHLHRRAKPLRRHRSHLRELSSAKYRWSFQDLLCQSIGQNIDGQGIGIDRKPLEEVLVVPSRSQPSAISVLCVATATSRPESSFRPRKWTCDMSASLRLLAVQPGRIVAYSSASKKLDRCHCGHFRSGYTVFRMG